MGKEAEQGVPVVASRLLPHQLVQVLPKLVPVHLVDAPQVDLGKYREEFGQCHPPQLGEQRFSEVSRRWCRDPQLRQTAPRHKMLTVRPG